MLPRGHSRINLIRMPKRSEHSLNRSGFGIPADSRSSQEIPTRNPLPRSLNSRPNFHSSGGLPRFYPALSCFSLRKIPRAGFILQVLFLRSVLRTNQVVLALLRHSTLAPTAAGAVSSVFAAAVRRVLGVSRLNCLIL